MTTGPRIDLFGVATDAGASTRGAGMGPEALRIAGLTDMLAELGRDVVDHGDFRAPRGKPKREKKRFFNQIGAYCTVNTPEKGFSGPVPDVQYPVNRLVV